VIPSSDVVVHNYWPAAGVKVNPGGALETILANLFRAILGDALDVSTLGVRVEMKHVFDRGGPPDIVPFSLFPVDYPTTTSQNLAADATRIYALWLLGATVLQAGWQDNSTVDYEPTSQCMAVFLRFRASGRKLSSRS
jgi:hypothetical protein